MWLSRFRLFARCRTEIPKAVRTGAARKCHNISCCCFVCIRTTSFFYPTSILQNVGISDVSVRFWWSLYVQTNNGIQVRAPIHSRERFRSVEGMVWNWNVLKLVKFGDCFSVWTQCTGNSIGRVWRLGVKQTMATLAKWIFKFEGPRHWRLRWTRTRFAFYISVVKFAFGNGTSVYTAGSDKVLTSFK